MASRVRASGVLALVFGLSGGCRVDYDLLDSITVGAGGWDAGAGGASTVTATGGSSRAGSASAQAGEAGNGTGGTGGIGLGGEAGALAGGGIAGGGTPATGGTLATGGTVATGGTLATGGTVATGGTATGGTATGGAGTGGTATGGTATGGAGTGGTATGGTATGGAGTGGTATGGTATGGIPATGGAATGGTATGGAGTGGAGTGGTATGGTGGTGAVGGTATGGTGGCSPTHGGVEICDGLDNDCANGVDDGVLCPSTCRGVAYDGNGYMFCDAEIAWQSAQAACAAQGMHLVKVDSAAENTFIGATAFGVGTAFLWLGGDDLTTEGSWHWPDGTLFWTGTDTGSAPPGIYTNWYTGCPGAGGNTDCLEMRDDYTWDDKQCTQGKRYVCELSY